MTRTTLSTASTHLNPEVGGVKASTTGKPGSPRFNHRPTTLERSKTGFLSKATITHNYPLEKQSKAKQTARQFTFRISKHV